MPANIFLRIKCSLCCFIFCLLIFWTDFFSVQPRTHDDPPVSTPWVLEQETQPFIYSFSHSPLYLFLNEVLLCSPGWLQFTVLLSPAPECCNYMPVPPCLASPYKFQIQGPCSKIENRDEGGLTFLFWIKWFGEVGWTLGKLVVLKSFIFILITQFKNNKML